MKRHLKGEAENEAIVVLQEREYTDEEREQLQEEEEVKKSEEAEAKEGTDNAEETKTEPKDEILSDETKIGEMVWADLKHVALIEGYKEDAWYAPLTDE